jgi:hypothetical protein
MENEYQDITHTVLNDIEVKDFINTLKQLKSSSEDYDIAVSNINNLKIKPIYMLLFAKEITGSKRKDFMKAFPRVDWPNAHELTYRELYNTVKVRMNDRPYSGDKENVQKIFTYLLATNISNSITDINTFDFIDKINIELKW